jgi:hypothetical protein
MLREQALNCPITGAILFAAQHLARGVEVRIDPANKAGADPYEALKVADRVSGALFEDLETTWPDTVSEILSMLWAGWALMELTYKRCQGSEPPRMQGEKLLPPPLNEVSGPVGQGVEPERFVPSKFSDGLLTWKSWSLRAQETLFMWEWDEDSHAKVMQQMAPPDYKVRRIPLAKCLHFRTQVSKQSPEGVSLLRHSFPSYIMKKNIQWVEGVGIERDLAGYPQFQVKPPDPAMRWVPPDIWNSKDAAMVSLLAQIKAMARGVKRDDQEGLVLPWWLDFTLKSAGGTRRQFDTNAIIERYEKRIAMSLLADFIMLGQDAVGSKALAEVKTNLFSAALMSIMNIIAAVINRFAIPELLRFNGIPEVLTPTLVFGDVENVSLEQLGNYIANLAKAGMPLFPDGDLENFLRDAAKMPNTDPNAQIQDQSAAEEEVQPAKPIPDAEAPVVPVPLTPEQTRDETRKWFDLAASYEKQRREPGVAEALVKIVADVEALKARADVAKAQPAPIVNIHQPAQSIRMPDVHVHEGAITVHPAPQGPAPVVNVGQPVVNVPAPVVNVTSPSINVEVPEQREMKRTQIVHRDENQLITHVETVEKLKR